MKVHVINPQKISIAHHVKYPLHATIYRLDVRVCKMPKLLNSTAHRPGADGRVIIRDQCDHVPPGASQFLCPASAEL